MPFSQSEGQSQSLKRRGWCDESLQEARKACKWALEATYQLELDIARLSQGMGNVQCQCPRSHSDSSHWSKSLDRWDRSPSQCRLERHVTFCKPELELFSGRGHCQKPSEHLSQAQMRGGSSACQEDGDTLPWRNAHGLPRCQEKDGWPIKAFNREIWGMVDLVGLLAEHTTMVERAGCHPRGWGPKEVGPDNLGLLPDSGG